MFVVCAVGRDGVEEWGFDSKRLRLLSRIGRYEHALRSIRAYVTVDMSISVGLCETMCSALLQSLKAEWGCRVDGCGKARLRPSGGAGDMIVVGRHRGGAVKISERL